MDMRREVVRKMLEKYSGDEAVLGMILVGSVTKEYHDEHSDVDLEVVVTEDRFDTLAKNHRKFIHRENYDLIFTTLDKLQRIKESSCDEDHWWYKDSTILLDKTGNLEEVLKRIAGYDSSSRLKRLKQHYLSYWQNILYAMSCLNHKSMWAARIYIALAMRDLIRLLFNFNSRWSPKLQWAFKEINLLERKPADLESKIEELLTKPDSEKLSRLWQETARLLRQERYTWIDHPEEIL